ncbi:SIS domain-containing protein [Herbiconiux sp. KACC 21604]|uniref:SIS domain-containing protein n=1 Tax=unclassified Herbiconiux TaxID=2618217 RepID=UPI001490A77B|nr:SIS domain-containing protein [Herbiconiux sp. SALV-R1]QJU54732.1 SIS domain-containing protein [Herbiconiux sp. SALV-R1]WPO85837.1 SIS domain-containing protein [Herbiconiux sp. KACC 21604]
MLNFDEARFIRIQSGALALAGSLDSLIGDLLDGGAKNIFFLGAGGAGVLMQPAAQLINRNADFPAYLENAAEMMAVGSSNLGAGSIVVVPSLSGTTKEAVEVVEFAKTRGAVTIALVGHDDTPVARAADHTFVNFAADDTSSESFYLQSLVLALSILRRRGEFAEYDETLAELDLLPALLVEAKRSFEDRAAALAESTKEVGYHIFTGAGEAWTEAWYFATCILEEMQWVRTRPVHASDFFHGTLELVEKGVSVFLLKGEDASRPLADRVESFAPTVTDSLTVIDSAEFELPGVSDRVRGLISHIVLATVLERYSAHLEIARDHPLTTRRYYRRLDY